MIFMSRFHLHRGAQIDELLSFAESQRWGGTYGPDLLRRFFTEFISDPVLVFDLWDTKQRVAVGVLLDKLRNPSNDACLELIGLAAGVDARAVIIEMVRSAASVLPASRSGLQLALPDHAGLSEAELETLGLRTFYDTFEMSRDLRNAATGRSPSIRIGERSDRDAVYQLAVEAFSENPDTSMPDEKTWKDHFLASPDSVFLLWENAGKLLGYANLIVDRQQQSAEVRTLGVSKTSRQRGIGTMLLRGALSIAKAKGMVTCHLTVAVQNRSALALYEREGFIVRKTFRCYRRGRNPSET